MDRRDLLPPGLGGPLTPGEERLTKCAASGEWWKPEIPTGVGFDSDPAKASTWPKECKVRAEVIYCLLTGVPWEKGSDIWSVHPKGLQLLNAYIDGKLDLEGCYLLASFWLHSSKVVGNVILMDATTRTVSFRRSHIQALNAERSTVEGALHLQGLHANQGVNLRSAYIRGQLACAGALLANENGAALNGGALKVGTDVFLNEMFHAKGEVILNRAEIGGGLSCAKAIFENENRVTLSCGALKVGANVSMRRGFRAKGEVNFGGAEIAGSFDCEDATFENKEGHALKCDSMWVGSDVILQNKFHALGIVNFIGAQVDGQLICDGGIFENAKGTALNCDGLKVASDVFLRNEFRATGEVNFIGATIGGDFRCQGGHFENANALALDLNSAKVSSGMFLSEVSSFKGDLDLRHAKATTFSDDERSWPQAGCVWLDGFSYDRFSETRTDSRIRIEWLKRQPKKHLNEDYRPQPWAQLIKALREMGHDEDAKKIAFERSNVVEQNMSWKCPMIFRKLFYKSFRITAGYGYYPSRTAYWSTFFLFFSWMTFWLAAERGYMSPRNDHPSDFAAFVYALDSFAPAIDLDQVSQWEPSTKKKYPINTNDYVLDGTSGFWLGNVVSDAIFLNGGHRILLWMERILGWIFVPLYIAGMSGILRKE